MIKNFSLDGSNNSKIPFNKLSSIIGGAYNNIVEPLSGPDTNKVEPLISVEYGGKTFKIEKLLEGKYNIIIPLIGLPINLAILLPYLISTCGVCGVIYLIILWLTTFMGDNMTVKEASNEEVSKRSMNRGTIVSIISAIILNLAGAIFTKRSNKKNKTADAVALWMGFILGPIIGYILDIGIGSETGYNNFARDGNGTFGNGIAYMMESLCDTQFMRYVVTFMLDMFISDTVMNGLMKVLGGKSGFQLALKSKTPEKIFDTNDERFKINNKSEPRNIDFNDAKEIMVDKVIQFEGGNYILDDFGRPSSTSNYVIKDILENDSGNSIKLNK